MPAPTFVVHIDADGHPEYLAFGGGDGRFLIIDERAPNDRVYAITRRLPRGELDRIVAPDAVIGDAGDTRHDALMHRIATAIAGEPLLRGVE